jgi:hypothetical protein
MHTLTGIEQQLKPCSMTFVGRQQVNPAKDAMVQGAGAKATSFPPMDTIKTSFVDMLSLINSSCGCSS